MTQTGLTGIFDVWLPAVLRVANSPQVTAWASGDARGRLRDALQDVIDGGDGSRGLLALESSAVVRWDAPEKPEPASLRWLPRQGFQIEFGQLVPVTETPAENNSETTLHAVVLALASDPRARRLRRCDRADCGKFFFAKGDHRRDHHFCCEEHRRAFDLAHRDPEQMAAYMRKRRAQEARRATAKRKQTKSQRRSR